MDIRKSPVGKQVGWDCRQGGLLKSSPPFAVGRRWGIDLKVLLQLLLLLPLLDVGSLKSDTSSWLILMNDCRGGEEGSGTIKGGFCLY